MDQGGKKAQRCVRQRMLAEQCRLMHIHAEPKHESHANTHAKRLVHIPEHQHQREEIRHPRHTPQRQHVQQQRHDQAAPDKNRVGRQQQLLAGSHDHAELSCAIIWQRLS